MFDPSLINSDDPIYFFQILIIPQTGLALMRFSRYCPSSLDLLNSVVQECRPGSAQIRRLMPPRAAASHSQEPGSKIQKPGSKIQESGNLEIQESGNPGIWNSGIQKKTKNDTSVDPQTTIHFEIKKPPWVSVVWVVIACCICSKHDPCICSKQCNVALSASIALVAAKSCKRSCHH